jgi:hypothetical protein
MLHLQVGIICVSLLMRVCIKSLLFSKNDIHKYKAPSKYIRKFIIVLSFHVHFNIYLQISETNYTKKIYWEFEYVAQYTCRVGG